MGKIFSQFKFHISHIADKYSQVTHELSKRPKVSAISIASHRYLSSMIDKYATNLNFKEIMFALALGKKDQPYDVKDIFVLYSNRLHFTCSLCEKVMYESHVSD